MPLQGCTSNYTFRNWAQTIKCKPDSYCKPDTEAKVVDIVKKAIQQNKKVRTVGAGHSWAPLALTRDILVSLDELNAVRTNTPNQFAVIEAGARLKDIIKVLRLNQLGFANLGSITEQSLAGVIGTGTHGTGLTFGSIGTQITSVRVVTGTGDVITVTELEKDRLNALRLSLGALGIITELTMKCVPDYNLEFAAYWCKFNAVVDQMDTLAQQHTRVKFWWLIPPIGGKEDVIMTTENPVAAGAPSGPSSGLPMDAVELFNNLFNFSGPTTPGQNPFLRYVDEYDDVLTIPLLPVFHRECEYAIPIGKTAEALRAFKRAVDEEDLSLTLPLEVRYVAKDEILLSPAYKQDICYIGVATQPNSTEVIERFEPIMKRLGGKPHWGKCYSLTRAEAEAMYPEYQKFRTIRNELDPNRVFSNEMLKYYFD